MDVLLRQLTKITELMYIDLRDQCPAKLLPVLRQLLETLNSMGY